MTNEKLSNLNDEQIRAMAHQIWQSRQESGETGNADTDWKNAVNVLLSQVDDLTTKKSALTQFYWLGIPIVLGIVAVVVMTNRGLF